MKYTFNYDLSKKLVDMRSTMLDGPFQVRSFFPQAHAKSCICSGESPLAVSAGSLAWLKLS